MVLALISHISGAVYTLWTIICLDVHQERHGFYHDCQFSWFIFSTAILREKSLLCVIPSLLCVLFHMFLFYQLEHMVPCLYRLLPPFSFILICACMGLLVLSVYGAHQVLFRQQCKQVENWISVTLFRFTLNSFFMQAQALCVCQRGSCMSRLSGFVGFKPLQVWWIENLLVGWCLLWWAL